MGGRDGVIEGMQYYGILFSFALFWFVFLSPIFPFPFPLLFLVLVLVFLCALATLRPCVPFFNPSLLSLCVRVRVSIFMDESQVRAFR